MLPQYLTGITLVEPAHRHNGPPHSPR